MAADGIYWGAGTGGWYRLRFSSDQWGLSEAGLAAKLGFDIARTKVRHEGEDRHLPGILESGARLSPH